MRTLAPIFALLLFTTTASAEHRELPVATSIDGLELPAGAEVDLNADGSLFSARLPPLARAQRIHGVWLAPGARVLFNADHDALVEMDQEAWIAALPIAPQNMVVIDPRGRVRSFVPAHPLTIRGVPVASDLVVLDDDGGVALATLGEDFGRDGVQARAGTLIQLDRGRVVNAELAVPLRVQDRIALAAGSRVTLDANGVVVHASLPSPLVAQGIACRNEVALHPHGGVASCTLDAPHTFGGVTLGAGDRAELDEAGRLTRAELAEPHEIAGGMLPSQLTLFFAQDGTIVRTECAPRFLSRPGACQMPSS